ncbi:S8 family serine peptidase [Sediminitomix flava]|uniref:Putative secreted protein (Por secretion system target) n=1 Tax=Sediminitomix flava TaxID=379075 RepID=A0A316A1T8_SEDFL|nr:S8 family serine peptidase [Sediminitomix flava]PWJ43657.1 putative secreted protein (Por secretion system target) [Sediminitomix flava]
MKVFITIFFILSTPLLSFAQSEYKLILLKDKTSSNYSIDTPSEYLSEKSIQRRKKQNIPINETDLPVSNYYVEEIKETGVEIDYTSKWLNAVLVKGNDEQIELIRNLDFVGNIASLTSKANDYFQSPNELEFNGSNSVTTTELQNKLLGIPQMHQDGFKGEGINIAVFDAGFIHRDWNSYFGHININDEYNFVGKNTDINLYHHHGYSVLSTIASYNKNEMIGTAYNANFSLYITEDVSNETRLEELYWLFAAERADSAGVDIINSSLGYFTFDNSSEDYFQDELNGKTSWISLAANFASTKGMLVVTSAGNEGNKNWEKIIFPADSPFVLSVGAIKSDMDLAAFSSIGPTADNRIKPDVVALGQLATVLSSSSNPVLSNGTSYSAPQIAGLAAGLWQRQPELTNLELIELIKSLGNNKHTPNNSYGWGLPTYDSLITSIESPLKNINVYPTLVEGKQISIHNIPQNVNDLTCNIYNIEGKNIGIHHFKSPNEIVTVNIPNKRQVYFLQIIAGNAQKTIRIFKK